MCNKSGASAESGSAYSHRMQRAEYAHQSGDQRPKSIGLRATGGVSFAVRKNPPCDPPTMLRIKPPQGYLHSYPEYGRKRSIEERKRTYMRHAARSRSTDMQPATFFVVVRKPTGHRSIRSPLTTISRCLGPPFVAGFATLRPGGPFALSLAAKPRRAHTSLRSACCLHGPKDSPLRCVPSCNVVVAPLLPAT